MAQKEVRTRLLCVSLSLVDTNRKSALAVKMNTNLQGLPWRNRSTTVEDLISYN